MSRSQNFAFVTSSAESAELLGRYLENFGRVDRLSGDAAHLTRSAVLLQPVVVFVDFVSAPGLPALALEPAAVTTALQKCLPEAVLVGVGNSADPAMTLLALRSGVSDFVDLNGPPESVQAVVSRVAQRIHASSRRATTIAIAGSRVGVGTSTLAAHLAALTTQVEGATQRVALIDLGLPAGDGLLYSNTLSGFDFVDAVLSLGRLDETLVRTALPVSPGGVSVLALPHDLSRMRTVPQADALMLLDQIRRYFDVIVVDLGGSGTPDLMASIFNLADDRLLMTDQGIASVVSLSELVQQLDERSVDKATLQLIVNRYDASYGMPAAQLAERFSLSLLATIPDRRAALGQAAALGKLLVEHKQDPYIKALSRLVENLLPREQDAAKAAATPLSNLTRLWRGRRS